MNNLFTKTLALSLIFCLLFSSIIVLQVYSFPVPNEKKININTASLTELQKLPRIGIKIAQRIIDFRNKHGKFKKIEEIMKVKGIGEKTFEKLKDKITVGSSKK